MSAGAAAAEVKISGDGRLGVVDNGTLATFSSRARISFAASADLDNGMKAGASLRADNAAAAGGGTGGSVFVSGDFGRIAFGDIDTALELAMGDLHGVGYGPTLTQNELAFLATADDPAVAYSNTVSGVSVYVNAGQRQALSANNDWSVGVKTAVAGVTIGAGVASADQVEQTGIALTYAMGDTTVKGALLRNDVTAATAVETETGLSVSQKFGLMTLSAFYRQQERVNGTSLEYTGAGLSYNLGGGAAASAGFVDNNGTSIWNAGMTFRF